MVINLIPFLTIVCAHATPPSLLTTTKFKYEHRIYNIYTRHDLHYGYLTNIYMYIGKKYYLLQLKAFLKHSRYIIILY